MTHLGTRVIPEEGITVVQQLGECCFLPGHPSCESHSDAFCNNMEISWSKFHHVVYVAFSFHLPMQCNVCQVLAYQVRGNYAWTLRDQSQYGDLYLSRGDWQKLIFSFYKFLKVIFPS